MSDIVWVTKDGESKPISRDKLNSYLAHGYVKGIESESVKKILNLNNIEDILDSYHSVLSSFRDTLQCTESMIEITESLLEIVRKKSDKNQT